MLLNRGKPKNFYKFRKFLTTSKYSLHIKIITIRVSPQTYTSRFLASQN